MNWKIRIPLGTNPLILLDMVKLFAITYLIVSLLFSIIFISTGDISDLPPMLGMFGLVMLGLAILFLLVMFVFFGNKIEGEYILTDKSVTFNTTDKRARLANRIATGAGLLGGSAATAGAGLTAMSNESKTFEWNWIQGFKPSKALRTISLRNSWRNVLVIYCGDNFGEAVEFVKSRVAVTEKRQKSPLPAMIGWTVLTLPASVLMFLEYPGYYSIDLFAAIFVMLFAVASLWLVPLLSYATFAGVAWVLGSTFYWGFIGGNFQYVHETEWIPYILLLVGQAFIVWIGIRVLQGGIVSMLMGDETGKH